MFSPGAVAKFTVQKLEVLPQKNKILLIEVLSVFRFFLKIYSVVQKSQRNRTT